MTTKLNSQDAHVLLVTLPGSPIQHVVFCESLTEALTHVDNGLRVGHFQSDAQEGRLATYQTGPGTFYLLLARSDYEKTIAEARRAQAGAIIQPGIIPPGRH